MQDSKTISRRPYMLRAMHQWLTDSSLTPHVIVSAEAPGAEVPAAYVRDGKIVLNISYSATQRLELGNDWIEFDARFSGVIQRVRFPPGAVLGIYARETGEGMVFSADEQEPEPPGQPDPAKNGEDSAKRPQLKIVK